MLPPPISLRHRRCTSRTCCSRRPCVGGGVAYVAYVGALRVGDEAQVLLCGLLVGVGEGLPDIVDGVLEPRVVGLFHLNGLASAVEELVDCLIVVRILQCGLDVLSSPAFDGGHQACRYNVVEFAQFRVDPELAKLFVGQFSVGGEVACNRVVLGPQPDGAVEPVLMFGA